MPEILKQIKEIFAHHELLLRLAYKEIKFRYKHPILGILWALIVPLAIILVFKIVFSLIIKIPLIEGYPFFVFLATAVFPWNFFQLSVSGCTLSIQENSNLIKKVYFPREIIPISIIVANFINFVITFIVIFPVLAFFRVRISNLVILLPLVLLLQTIFTTGICLIFSGLQVRFRDVKYIVEILLLIWFYLTPIFYPLDLVFNISRNFFNIYMLNPLTQIITLYRSVLLGGYIDTLPGSLNLFNLAVLSSVSSLAVFFIGFWIFNRHESEFADLV
ncbi:MAG: ABC transporter permease [Candidatus Omnitrophota bacterium]